MTQFDQPSSWEAIRQNAMHSGYFQLLDLHIDDAQDEGMYQKISVLESGHHDD